MRIGGKWQWEGKQSEDSWQRAWGEVSIHTRGAARAMRAVRNAQAPRQRAGNRALEKLTEKSSRVFSLFI